MFVPIRRYAANERLLEWRLFRKTDRARHPGSLSRPWLKSVVDSRARFQSDGSKARCSVRSPWKFICRRAKWETQSGMATVDANRLGYAQQSSQPTIETRLHRHQRFCRRRSSFGTTRNRLRCPRSVLVSLIPDWVAIRIHRRMCAFIKASRGQPLTAGFRYFVDSVWLGSDFKIF